MEQTQQGIMAQLGYTQNVMLMASFPTIRNNEWKCEYLAILTDLNPWKQFNKLTLHLLSFNFICSMLYGMAMAIC